MKLASECPYYEIARRISEQLLTARDHGTVLPLECGALQIEVWSALLDAYETGRQDANVRVVLDDDAALFATAAEKMRQSSDNTRIPMDDSVLSEFGLTAQSRSGEHEACRISKIAAPLRTRGGHSL